MYSVEQDNSDLIIAKGTEFCFIKEGSSFFDYRRWWSIYRLIDRISGSLVSMDMQ